MRDRRRAALVLLAISATAALELVAAALAYRTSVDADDWEAAAAAIAALPPDEPVLLAEDWLGPRARMQLPALATWLGLPDLHGAPRVHVLALGDPWPDALREDLGELRPEPLGEQRLGALTLHHAALPGSGRTLWDLRDDPSLTLRDERGACRLSRGTWSCKQGRAALEYAEVGYRARRCLTLAAPDGTTLELARADAPLGTRLRGHLGLADFNARLRSDAPVLVELAVDGVVRGRWALTDAQGWAAFEVPTTPGTGDVRLRVTTLLGGSFTGPGYDPDATRTACVELRALAEDAP